MAAMKEIWEDIHYLLDTTKCSCADIADHLGCPVEWVEDVVEERWLAIVNRDEVLSPFATCNS